MVSRETPMGGNRGISGGGMGMDALRRRRLLMGVPEVAPLLSMSSSSYSSSSSFSFSFLEGKEEVSSPHTVVSRAWRPIKTFSLVAAAASIFRSFLPAIQSMLAPACHWLTLPPAIASTAASMQRRRKMTGTFFGTKRGRVCFAVQEDPRSEPVLLLDLAVPTSHLVKEMASGMVRILLECERGAADPDANASGSGSGSGKKKRRHLPRLPLWEEPLWMLYCNGQKRGYAVSRRCGEADFTVLRAIQAVSVGAGVLPLRLALPSTLERKESLKGEECLKNVGGGSGGGGDVMYMRARFERVVGGRDSEAFYMISPDRGRGASLNNGAPELSIFLLRM